MSTQTSIVDQIRRSLNEGARLADVDSTDDRLLLELRSEQGTDRFQLDAEAIRSLQNCKLLQALTTPKTSARTLLP